MDKEYWTVMDEVLFQAAIMNGDWDECARLRSKSLFESSYEISNRVWLKSLNTIFKCHY